MRCFYAVDQNYYDFIRETNDEIGRIRDYHGRYDSIKTTKSNKKIQREAKHKLPNRFYSCRGNRSKSSIR